MDHDIRRFIEITEKDLLNNQSADSTSHELQSYINKEILNTQSVTIISGNQQGSNPSNGRDTLNDTLPFQSYNSNAIPSMNVDLKSIINQMKKKEVNSMPNQSNIVNRLFRDNQVLSNITNVSTAADSMQSNSLVIKREKSNFGLAKERVDSFSGQTIDLTQPLHGSHETDLASVNLSTVPGSQKNSSNSITSFSRKSIQTLKSTQSSNDSTPAEEVIRKIIRKCSKIYVFHKLV